MRRLLLIVLFLTACTRDRDAQCAPFVYDPGTHACVCPPGSIAIPEAGACELPDGGELRMDGAAADAGPCVPTAELCNGLDDDCDGAIDGLAASASCGTRDHATGLACTAGECVVTTCADGFGNCDEEAENGCEARLDTLDHCGSCGNACGWECAEGDCDDAVQVDSSHSSHTCVLRESGRIACWGNNEFGELGLGDAGAGTDRALPAHVVAPDGVATFDGAVEISVGTDHTCARKGDGSVWCWGLNDARQLGDGTTTNRSRPVQAAVVGAVSIAAGWRGFSCAVLGTGRVMCWGANDRAQLGVGDRLARTVPTQVFGIETATRVEAHGAFACALLRDGTMRCWGHEGHGALGNGLAATLDRPVSPTGVDRVVDIAASRESACALRDDATVWCWGSNYGGQISSRWDYADHHLPVRVDGIPIVPTAIRMGWQAIVIDVEGRVATLDALVDPGASPARDAVDGAHSCVVHRRGSVRCSPNRLAAELPFADLVAP